MTQEWRTPAHYPEDDEARLLARDSIDYLQNGLVTEMGADILALFKHTNELTLQQLRNPLMALEYGVNAVLTALQTGVAAKRLLVKAAETSFCYLPDGEVLTKDNVTETDYAAFLRVSVPATSEEEQAFVVRVIGYHFLQTLSSTDETAVHQQGGEVAIPVSLHGESPTYFAIAYEHRPHESRAERETLHSSRYRQERQFTIGAIDVERTALSIVLPTGQAEPKLKEAPALLRVAAKPSWRVAGQPLLPLWRQAWLEGGFRSLAKVDIQRSWTPDTLQEVGNTFDALSEHLGQVAMRLARVRPPTPEG